MNLSLARDLLWRGRAMFAAAAVLLFTGVRFWSPELADPRTSLAVSALAAAYVSLGVPLMLLMSREIAQLPVSRTEFWRTRCALGLSLTLAGGFAIKTIAVALRASWVWPRLPDVLLSTVVDTLFVGSLLGLAALWPAGIVPIDPRRRRWSIGGLAVMFAAGAAPWLVRHQLPARWSEVTPAHWLAGAACALLTAAALAHRPIAGARGSRRIPPSRRRRRSVLPRPTEWFTGIGRLFWLHAAFALFVAPPLIGLALWCIETTGAMHERGLRDLLHSMQVMPFDAAYPFDGPRPLPVFFFIWMGTSDRVREMVRRARTLRVLPITAGGWSACFSMLALVWTAAMWIWLIAVHRVVVGTWPQTLRPDLFVTVAGAIALAQALDARFGSWGGRIWSFVAITATAVFVARATPSVLAQLWMIGSIAFAIALWLMRRTFLRRQSIYKFVPQTFFGMPAPGTGA